MNPNRARMVELPAEYRWSSYRANAQGETSWEVRSFLPKWRPRWGEESHEVARASQERSQSLVKFGLSPITRAAY